MAITPKHIVYLMLENRSLDHVLGWLYADGTQPAHIIAPQGYDDPQYQGLQGESYFNLDSDGNKHFVVRGTGGDTWIPTLDPYEVYEHVNKQLFESGATPPHCQEPTMGGFYKDFATDFDTPSQIMLTYDRPDLNVLYGVAQQFAVSDAYFSSVPTQTNCNRAFAATGNSLAPSPNDGSLWAWVDNNMGGWDPFKNNLVFNQRTMFNVLQEAGGSWKIFASEAWEPLGTWCFTRDMFSQLQDGQYDRNFGTIDDFYNSLEAGTLPAVSFLEPKWGLVEWHDLGWHGDDYHPPDNVALGEAFLAKLLNALQTSPAWNDTLFILNFDEHGGTYDHVKPPCTAATPWGGTSVTPTPPNSNREQGFGFDRFGVRVPLILVSAHIKAGTVFRAGAIPYDHTSVIATILKMQGIPQANWKLGNRVDQAPTFENVLTLAVPRAHHTLFRPAAATLATIAAGPKMDPPPSELQREIALRMMRHHMQRTQNLAAEAIAPAAVAPLMAARTISELADTVAAFRR